MRPFASLLLAVSATFAALATAPEARAQAPKVGEEAPSYELESWCHLAAGAKPPSPESLAGKVVLLEFWGTWCAPCVRAMPRLQALHDRLKERGLVVLGISYETVELFEPFAKRNGWTFAMGSDPAKRVIEAYGVKSWPTSFVIGADGKVAHVGSPYDVEPAIEKALGLETSPAALLTAALAALASKDKQRIADDVGRVAERTALELDLKEWAIGAGGVAKAGGSAEQKRLDADGELDRLAAAWGDPSGAARQQLLDRLASEAPTLFDAVPWAKKAHGRVVPIKKAQFTELLTAQRWTDALDALWLRSPPADVLAAAARHKGMKEHAAAKAAVARTEAKRGLLCQLFVLAGRPAKDNDAYWSELSVSGMRTSPDGKAVTGVLLANGDATVASVDFYVERHLAHAFLMESLAAGKPPALGGLAEKIAKEREQLSKAIEKKYGE